MGPKGVEDVTPLGDPAKVGGGSGNVGTPIPKGENEDDVMSEPEPEEREPEEEKLNDLRVPNGAKDVAKPLGDPAKVGGSSGNVGTPVPKAKIIYELRVPHGAED